MIAFTKDEIFTISLALKNMKLECEKMIEIINDKELIGAYKNRIKDCVSAYGKVVKEYKSLEARKN